MIKSLALATLGLLAASPAFAACYDTFGCTDRARFHMSDLMSGPTCQFLYTMRNQIYAEHGYCFHTARAQETFGNAGCVTGDVNALRLNATERANAATIAQAEKAKGCDD